MARGGYWARQWPANPIRHYFPEGWDRSACGMARYAWRMGGAKADPKCKRCLASVRYRKDTKGGRHG